MDSLLTSIKKLLGITVEYTHFDTDLVMHINSVFMVLNQLGVGPSEGFSITDSYATWNDFLGDSMDVEVDKSYMYLKVKLLFDPPLSASVMEAMNRSIDEFEWRLNVAAELNATEEDDQYE